MWLGTRDSLRNVKYRDTMRLCHYCSSFEIWESLKICWISKVCEAIMVWQTDWRTTQHIIGLHRRQQLLFCSEICVHLDSERNYLLPGVRCWCWPHCQCSGDIDLLATLGPMLQFPAPPLRCHSNGCLCAEMSRNGTKPDNFQWHTDTERYIAAHCQAAASKLGLKRVRKLYL